MREIGAAMIVLPALGLLIGAIGWRGALAFIGVAIYIMTAVVLLTVQ